MSTEFEQLKKLPVAQKLRIVEELWDDIGASEEVNILQEWHKDEARRRATELDVDPDLAITREEVWKRVDASDG